MKSWKRLLFYLTLNVLVSACTILAVLFVWDQMAGPLPRGLLPRFFGELKQPAVTAAPTAEAAETTPGIQATPTEAFIVYQVKSGDTFDSIAETYKIPVDELIAVNGFTGNQPLGEGEVLRIPMRPAGSVVIDSVIGAGDLASEHVLLRHARGGEISLTGWRLEDGKGNVFVFPEFPQLTLYANGAVNLYTTAGVNSVVELYWGLDHPMWASGSTVILKDAQGNVQARYLVP